MRVLTLLLAGCALISVSPSGYAIEFDLMHTKPECKHPGKPVTWCKREDRKANAKRAGMEARAAKMIAKAKGPSAYIAMGYFSFSNYSVGGKLCDAGERGVEIDAFFDNDYRGAELPEKLGRLPSGGKRNVRVHFLGQKNVSVEPIIWRLHHNKFLIVDPGNGADIEMGFSSGNASSFGLSNHFDHWGIIKASANTNVIKAQKCSVHALRRAIDHNGDGKDEPLDDPELYRSTLERCFVQNKIIWSGNWGDLSKWVEAAIQKEGIAPLYTPNPDLKEPERALIDSINRVRKGGRIYGAMQHFKHGYQSFEGKFGIAGALHNAQDRGVKVSMIMDDDVILGHSEVPGVREFYDEWLDPVVSGFRMLFMQTSSSNRQMMHQKFLVMEGVDGNKTRVFSGAGHFTYAAMRRNYENFYLTQNDGFSAKYKALYEYMRKNAVPQNKVTDFEF